MRLRTSIVLLLVFAFLLSMLQGCGWRLRGSNTLELDLPPVFLQFQSASGALQTDLHKALQSGAVPMVGKADEAEIRLIVHRDSQGRRVLSVGSAGKVSEYELQYQIQFSILDKDGATLVEDVIKQQRDYSFDETQVLAKSDEEKRLFDFMRRTAVQSLLRRLQSVVSNQGKAEQVEQAPAETVEQTNDAN